MTPYRDTSWSPFFASFPPDCVPPPDAFAEPDAPFQRLLNALLLGMTKRGFGLRWTPDASDARFVVFRDGERLGEENPSPALAAAFLGRLREMSGLRQPPPEVGRITLLLGETRAVVFAVHARLAGPNERLIVSPLRGVDAPRPSPDEAMDVARLSRALEEGRVDDDVAKLERVLEGAGRLKSGMGAQLAAEAALALGHLAFHDGANPRALRSLARTRAAVGPVVGGGRARMPRRRRGRRRTRPTRSLRRALRTPRRRFRRERSGDARMEVRRGRAYGRSRPRDRPRGMASLATDLRRGLRRRRPHGHDARRP
ncbi:MAG: hypothetical protein R3B99_34195 [Polyangiales bacterium]